MEIEWQTCQEVLRADMQILSLYLLFISSSFSSFSAQPNKKEN